VGGPSSTCWRRAIVPLAELIGLVTLFVVVANWLGTQGGAYVTGALACLLLTAAGHPAAVLVFVPLEVAALHVFWYVPVVLGAMHGDSQFITGVWFLLISGTVLTVCEIGAIACAFIARHRYFVLAATLTSLLLLYVVFEICTF
jgi:hypothetical protein